MIPNPAFLADTEHECPVRVKAAALLGHLGTSVSRETSAAVADVLEELIHAYEERIAALEAQARAVAEANVKATTMVLELEEDAQWLLDENTSLAFANSSMEATRATLEAESRAIADATVEAALQVAALEDHIVELRDERAVIERENVELQSQSVSLTSETRSLAAANVEAALLLAEHAEALESARVHKDALVEQNQILRQRAFRDEKTGLYNYAYFAEQVERELSRAQRYDQPLSIAIIDVDHFKQYNDRNGHPAGDAVLAQLGALLNKNTRTPDIKARIDAGPFAVRYGGEEFVLVLPQTPHEGARLVAERLRHSVEVESFEAGDQQPLGHVSISVGVASMSAGDTVETLLERADKALYSAKDKGRNRVEG